MCVCTKQKSVGGLWDRKCEQECVCTKDDLYGTESEGFSAVAVSIKGLTPEQELE